MTAERTCKAGWQATHPFTNLCNTQLAKWRVCCVCFVVEMGPGGLGCDGARLQPSRRAPRRMHAIRWHCLRFAALHESLAAVLESPREVAGQPALQHCSERMSHGVRWADRHKSGSKKCCKSLDLCRLCVYRCTRAQFEAGLAKRRIAPQLPQCCACSIAGRVTVALLYLAAVIRRLLPTKCRFLRHCCVLLPLQGTGDCRAHIIMATAVARQVAAATLHLFHHLSLVHGVWQTPGPQMLSMRADAMHAVPAARQTSLQKRA